MQDFSLGAGLAALAFWGFIATVVVAGVWSDIRKKEARQETIRRVLESGQKIDEALIDRLLNDNSDKDERLDRGLKIAGLITLPAGIGLAILGYALGLQNVDARLPLYGVSGLVLCVGAGLLVASKVASRWYEQDDKSDQSSV